MRFFYLPIFFLVFAFGRLSSQPPITMDDAFNQALANGQNVIVQYESGWCDKCNLINQLVIANPYIQSVIESDYVLVVADIDNEISKEWFKEYQVTCFPTVHILDDQGQVLFGVTESITEEGLYSALLIHAKSINDDMVAEQEIEQADRIDDHHDNSQKDKTTSQQKYARTYSGATILVDHTLEASDITQPKMAVLVSKVEAIIQKRFTITVGAFSVYKNAERCIQSIQDLHPGEFFIEEDTAKGLYRVNLGRYTERKDCAPIVRQLKLDQIDCYVRSI